MKWNTAIAIGIAASVLAACSDDKSPTSGITAPGRARANSGVSGAGFTTVNEDVDGTGHCKNGNPLNNCNLYDGKQYVWLNGGPQTAYVGNGTYFFAVLAPGGQANPNDGATNNLSDDFDTYSNRTFTVADGVVSYSGSHDFANNKIRLMSYADTPNPGGVYIMAICSLADGYPAEPRNCKYDAFKAGISDGGGGEAADLTVLKNASASYKNTFTWGIAKAVDKTIVKQVGGSATFNYTVSVTHDGGTISDVKVTGIISVFNPNVDASSNVVTVHGVDITDKLSDGTTCTVTNGASQDLTALSTDFAYTCNLTGLPAGSLDNTVTVTWPTQTLSNDAALTGSSAQFTFSSIAFTPTLFDNSAVITDTYAGTLGTVTSSDASPKDFTYARTIAIPQYACLSYDNTAKFTTNTTGTTGSASQTVQVCGPIHTGGLTMGFWQNKNGQAIISNGSSTSGVCDSGTWLRQYAPFQDLSATAKCSAVATYVFNVIKAANASGAAMNAMLKGQMLATALDVYFSDPALGGNKIGAPGAIGGVTIDLTQVTPSGSVSAAFGGATSLTVSQILAYAAGQSNVGGSTWYGQIKTTQELAKNTFDAINNEHVFAP